MMTEVRYAVFESATPSIQQRGGRLQPLHPGKGLLPRSGPDFTSIRTTKVEPQEAITLLQPDEAEAARAAGKELMRVPKMPVRLIPQVASGADTGLGEAWGIGAVGADRPGPSGEGVCVAVLDTGIDPSHPAFAGLITKDNYKDFTGTGLIDNVGHGTHCAGIIFGRTVNDVRIGVSPGVSKVLIGKIADRDFATTTDQLQEALTWAVNSGADIISLSVGLDFLGHARALGNSGLPQDAALVAALNDYRDYTRFFDRLMGQISNAGAANRTALVIAASGNDSHADQTQPYRVAATLPAGAENVLAVGAISRDTDGTFALAAFSNSAADLCGPGTSILSTAPGGGYATMSGTSQAAPHVAGIAARWWQKLRKDIAQRPSPDLVRSLIIGAARRDRIKGKPTFEEIGAGLVAAPT